LKGVATLVQKLKPKPGQPKVFISKKVLFDKMDQKDRDSSL